MKLSDTSCIVCVFTEINKPFILMEWMKRGYKITITNQVYEEIKNNQETYELVNPEINNGKIDINNIITKEEITEFRKRYPMLGFGECSIILTALKLENEKKRYYAILDDGKARKIAKDLGIKLTGTYGLLKNLKDKGVIEEHIFNQCIEDINNSKFRIDFGKIL